jgi:chromosome transmission fidelity protein 8
MCGSSVDREKRGRENCVAVPNFFPWWSELFAVGFLGGAKLWAEGTAGVGHGGTYPDGQCTPPFDAPPIGNTPKARISPGQWARAIINLYARVHVDALALPPCRSARSEKEKERERERDRERDRNSILFSRLFSLTHTTMASSIKLYPRNPGAAKGTTNPLPELIHTPSGLALLELQGTINLPQHADEGPAPETLLGRIAFPDFNPDTLDPSSTAWMKRVHLYVGQFQRLTGEVKKLPRPLAVVQKRKPADGELASEDLEVVEIVKYKLIFSQRPEPVGTAST